MIFQPKNEYILGVEGAPQWVWSMAVGVVVCWYVASNLLQ
jgi:hypothetical protein